jgi:hypothetical protein
MKPGALLIAWSLAAAIMLGGCASTSSGNAGKVVATSAAEKNSPTGTSKIQPDGAAKDVQRPPNKAVAREPGKSSAKRKPEAETAALKPAAEPMTPQAALAKAIAEKNSSTGTSKIQPDGAAKDVKRPPNKAVAREPDKSSAKRKPEAETAALKPAAAPMTPEAALAKAIAEEKAYDQGLRQRFGVSTDLDLGGLISPEEAKEATRLHAVTEAARRRLRLADKGPKTLPAEVRTLSIKGPNDIQPIDASVKATASLPTIPEAGATAPAKTQTALHLGGWLLDEKAHQAWREKQLAKLAAAKNQPTPAPAAK